MHRPALYGVESEVWQSLSQGYWFCACSLTAHIALSRYLSTYNVMFVRRTNVVVLEVTKLNAGAGFFFLHSRVQLFGSKGRTEVTTLGNLSLTRINLCNKAWALRTWSWFYSFQFFFAKFLSGSEVVKYKTTNKQKYERVTNAVSLTAKVSVFRSNRMNLNLSCATIVLYVLNG